jgi:hypothetical protein
MQAEAQGANLAPVAITAQGLHCSTLSFGNWAIREAALRNSVRFSPSLSIPMEAFSFWMP